MADISQIKLPNNNTYNFKDTLARGVKMYYGLCTSADDTAAKVVTVGADQDFKLTVGALVMVKFTISNSARNVTLNVNSTGAKSIYYNNAVYTGPSTTVCGYANAHFIYMYDGTNWVWVGHGSDSTPNIMSVAEGEAATATNGRAMRADYLKQIIQYHAVPSGQGVPSGGTTGQILTKADDTDYNTEWVDPPSGIEWEDVDYAEVKTIPTESFYWHIPEPGKKTPSSSNLTLMPFLFAVAGRGSQTLGGDIYFKREYYDTTNYMDTFVFIPSTANTDAFIMTRYKNSLWKCESYCLFSFYITGTFNTTTQKYTFAASNLTLENVTGTQKAVLKWIGYIIYNEIGNLDIYGKLKGNGSTICDLNDGGPAYIKVNSFIKGTSSSTYANTGFNLSATWISSGYNYIVLMNVSGFHATPSVGYSTIISA